MPAALVLFGDVIRSRRDAPASTAWLRILQADLAAAYAADDVVAPFGFTQGDELQGLLAPTADPRRAILRAALHPAAIGMRWVVVAGDVDPGHGPATQRSGPAFIAARERLVTAAARRERLAVVTGDAATDELLAGIGPAPRRSPRGPDRSPARDRVADPGRRRAPVRRGRAPRGQPGDGVRRGRPRPPPGDRRSRRRRADLARPGDDGVMNADPILVLAWLVLAHLVADFVLQTGSVAAAKSSHGARAVRGLLAHGAVVAVCVVPVGLAWGERGWWYVAVAALSHVLIDRTKVVLTRRAAAAAVREARQEHEGPQPADHLGRAWTPRPAALFLADQAAHLAVVGGAWAVLLSGTGLASGWTATIGTWLGGWDQAVVHRIAGGAVVFAILGIVNVRAASLFVGILVRPVETGVDGEHRWGSRAAPATQPVTVPPTAAVTGAVPAAAAAARRWSIRLGPLDAHVTAEAEPAAGPASTPPPVAPAPIGSSARVGSTIGMLERILIVVFVLTGTDVAIGFVVAAKTLARFKLLDDRAFAEYYLLGTLASVAVAIVTALVGRAALAVLLS